MGLFDSVVGALGGVGGAGGGAQPDLMQIVTTLLGPGGGGLRALTERFQEGGFGAQMASWVGTGENLPITPAQLTQVLGPDMLGGIAQKLGLSSGDLAGQLAQILPQAVDRLTPDGELPRGGADGLPDLTGLLASLLNR